MSDEPTLEKKWIEQGGVDPETGEMWLTPRMEKEADQIAEDLTTHNPMLTPDEFCKQMDTIRIYCARDKEAMHSDMDDLMCNLLVSLGYQDGVKIFESCDLWYA